MQKGMSVSWQNGSHHGTILKINSKTVFVMESNGKEWRISPNLLTVTNSNPSQQQITVNDHLPTVPKPSFVPSTIQSKIDLKNLLIQTKTEMWSLTYQLFSSDEQKKLYDVQIQWGSKRTYRNCGKYYPFKNYIQISPSFKNTPEYVIKSIIWHEILHIHFNPDNGVQAHGTDFRCFERECPQYTEAKHFKIGYLRYLKSIYR